MKYFIKLKGAYVIKEFETQDEDEKADRNKLSELLILVFPIL